MNRNPIGWYVHNKSRRQATKNYLITIRPGVEAILQEKLSLKQTAEKLNEAGFSTITGKKFNAVLAHQLIKKLREIKDE